MEPRIIRIDNRPYLLMFASQDITDAAEAWLAWQRKLAKGKGIMAEGIEIAQRLRRAASTLVDTTVALAIDDTDQT